MKITFTKASIKTGGALQSFYYDMTIGTSNLTITSDDTFVYVVDGLTPFVFEVKQILNNGGEVNNYLMAIQADISFLDVDILAGLPNRLDVLGVVKKFKVWFEATSEVYINDAGTRVYFLTNPIGTSEDQYLTGSEIVAIESIVGINADVDTVNQFNTAIAANNWNKVIF